MYIRVGNGPEQRFKSEVRRVTVPSIGLGEPSHSLPEVTGVVFRNGNGNTPDPDNCCAICVDLRLGVRQNASSTRKAISQTGGQTPT